MNPAISRRLSDYTKISVEFLVAILSVAPILILIYFYADLPDRVPVFLNLRGEVQVWATKSIASVFRVPAMAIDLQVLCLLMKYGVVKSKPAAPSEKVEGYWEYQRHSTALFVGLWDSLRCLVAFKMSAESLDILFMTERFRFLRTPAWAIPWIAAILSIAGALFYGYRLLVIRRKMKKGVQSVEVQKEIDNAHLYLGIIYYNPDDPAMFVNRYLFNFGNKWVYVLFASVVAYPLLVFSPF